MSAFESQTWLEPLNSREREILSLLADGLSNREIARQLLLSLETVKWYNKQIFSKLGVSSRAQAVIKARQHGLLEDGGASQVKTESPAMHNLPAPITSFIGRRREIEEIKGLLKASRLVVLTGAGGSGKTRLALQVARELLVTYRDGVWLVELARIGEESLVPEAIAQALKLSGSGDAPPLEVVKRSLARRHLLLLLDNFEHLPGAAPLAGEILAAAPQVTILATSRERLHVYGEHEYPLHPLELPDLSRRESPERLLGYDAVNLFVQRARAAQPAFSLSEAQAPAVAQVCVRLDGLPLALELAASQVKVLSPVSLAGRLQASLGALGGGSRDLPARQRTLRATLQWSYDLLQGQEKTLFARLGVFNGGGSLESIAAICAQGLRRDVLDIVISLVDKSLAYPRTGEDGEPRFSMLETIREFARERLEASGEAASLRRLHADHFTALAEQAQPWLSGARQTYWYARLRAEHDNFRDALAWSLETGEIRHSLRLVALLRDFWYYNGYSAEGLRWANLALGKAGDASPALHAGALLAAGYLASALGDRSRSKELLSQSLHLYRQLGDEANTAYALIFLSYNFMENPDQCRAGRALCQEGLALFQKLGLQPGIARALNILGELTRREGDYQAAQGYYEECLRIARQSGDPIRIAMQHANLSFIAYRRQDYRSARRLIMDSLLIILDTNNNYYLANSITCLAGSTAALGEPQRAARLLGAGVAALEAMGARDQPADEPEIDLYTRTIRSQLGEEDFQKAWQEGQAMSLHEAVTLALSGPDE